MVAITQASRWVGDDTGHRVIVITSMHERR